MIGERQAIAVHPGDFTTLLQQCAGGNREALDALTPARRQPNKPTGAHWF
jgi:hypothetical protein